MGQAILSYECKKSLYEITKDIKEQVEKSKMRVQQITLTSSVRGYTEYYSALVILEDLEEKQEE